MADINSKLVEFLALCSKDLYGMLKKDLVLSSDLYTAPAFLFENVPASRTAVLDFYGTVVEDAIKRFVDRIDYPAQSQEYVILEEAVLEFACSLRNLLDRESSQFVIFEWALTILAQISRRNQERKGFPIRLNSVLQIYTSCGASRHMLELIDVCVGKLLVSDPEKCVGLILSLFSKNPSFDWILTYIGIHHPRAIVSQLLQVGLKDYESTYKTKAPFQGPRTSSYGPIFAHLAMDNPVEVRKQIFEMMKAGLKQDGTSRNVTIPFLFRLFNSQPSLFRIMVSLIPEIVTLENISRMKRCLEAVPEKALWALDTRFPIQVERRYPDMICRVFGDLDPEGYWVAWQKLVWLAFMDQRELNQEYSILLNILHEPIMYILDFLVGSMERIVHSRQCPHPKDLPAIYRLASMLPEVVKEAFSRDTDRSRFYFRMLCLIAWAFGSGKSVDILHLILSQARTDKELSMFINFAKIIHPYHPQVIREAMETLVSFADREAEEDPKRWWVKNLVKLIKWEASDEGFGLVQSLRLCEGFHEHLGILGPRLLAVASDPLDRAAANWALDVLRQACESGRLNPSQLQRIVTMACHLWFQRLSCSEVSHLVADCSKVWDWLFALVSSHNNAKECLAMEAISLAVKHRKDLFVNSYHDHVQSNDCGLAENVVLDLNASITEANKNQLSSMGCNSAANMIHSGYFARARKVASSEYIHLQPVHILRRQLLLSMLERLCSLSRDNPTGDFAWDYHICRLVCQHLTEAVCPDAISAAYHWEPLAEARGSVERYIALSKTLLEQSYLWDLIYMLAEVYPCGWLLSPIIKAFFHYLLGRCDSVTLKTDTLPSSDVAMIDRLFSIFIKGNMIPKCLGYIPDIVTCVNAHECGILLRDIWTYFQFNLPTQQELERSIDDVSAGRACNLRLGDASEVTDNLKLIVLSHIEELGFLFPKLFPSLEGDS